MIPRIEGEVFRTGDAVRITHPDGEWFVYVFDGESFKIIKANPEKK